MGVKACPHFDEFWFPAIPERELRIHWDVGRYIRFESFMNAEPPSAPVQPCVCGKPDQWKCWNRTRSARLMKTI